MAREFEPTPEMIPAEDYRFAPSVRVQQIIKEP
jgi:hypothetical protein